MTTGCVVAWQDLKPILLNDIECPEGTVGSWERLCGDNSLRVFIESKDQVRCLRLLFQEEDMRRFRAMDPVQGVHCATVWAAELRATIASGRPVEASLRNMGRSLMVHWAEEEKTE